jgi:hypothetical protein
MFMDKNMSRNEMDLTYDTCVISFIFRKYEENFLLFLIVENRIESLFQYI